MFANKLSEAPVRQMPRLLLNIIIAEPRTVYGKSTAGDLIDIWPCSQQQQPAQQLLRSAFVNLCPHSRVCKQRFSLKAYLPDCNHWQCIALLTRPGCDGRCYADMAWHTAVGMPC